jgi:hypothetical protein
VESDPSGSVSRNRDQSDALEPWNSFRGKRETLAWNSHVNHDGQPNRQTRILILVRRVHPGWFNRARNSLCHRKHLDRTWSNTTLVARTRIYRGGSSDAQSPLSRFHDIGWSGRTVLVAFVPLLDVAALLFLLVMPGQKQPNRYGEPTKFLRRLRKTYKANVEHDDTENGNKETICDLKDAN